MSLLLSLLGSIHFAEFSKLGSKDRVFPWTIIIFDGNLLCIYFINVTWQRVLSRFRFGISSLSELNTGNSSNIRESVDALKAKSEDRGSEGV